MKMPVPMQPTEFKTTECLAVGGAQIYRHVIFTHFDSLKMPENQYGTDVHKFVVQ